MRGCCGPRPADPKPGKADIVIKVPDISCNHCKMAIEKAVKNLGGVHDVNIDLASKEVKVSYDSTDVREEDIKQAIEDAGYTAQ